MSVDASKPSQKTLPDVAVARTAAKATVLACILRHVDATREDRPWRKLRADQAIPASALPAHAPLRPCHLRHSDTFWPTRTV